MTCARQATGRVPTSRVCVHGDGVNFFTFLNSRSARDADNQLVLRPRDKHKTDRRWFSGRKSLPAYSGTGDVTTHGRVAPTNVPPTTTLSRWPQWTPFPRSAPCENRAYQRNATVRPRRSNLPPPPPKTSPHWPCKWRLTTAPGSTTPPRTHT